MLPKGLLESGILLGFDDVFSIMYEHRHISRETWSVISTENLVLVTDFAVVKNIITVFLMLVSHQISLS